VEDYDDIFLTVPTPNLVKDGKYACFSFFAPPIRFQFSV
jgi:hypothetical protein